MPSRTAHRCRLIVDRDVLHAGAVAVAACVLSAGLVYVGYFVHVLRVARQAPCLPEHGECVLLFGKHAPQGRIDRDFAARLDRADVAVARTPAGAAWCCSAAARRTKPSEAEVARGGLLARGLAADAPLRLEAQSRDTLQNLRNARDLLGGAPVSAPRVTLLSSRYHLARCALFARQLGFDWELCAAEPRLRLGPRTLLRIAGEAAYVCLDRHRHALGAVDRPPPHAGAGDLNSLHLCVGACAAAPRGKGSEQARHELLRRHRSTEQVALQHVAAQQAQQLGLFFFFDAFGHHVQRQRVGQGDDVGDQRQRLAGYRSAAATNDWSIFSVSTGSRAR